MAWDKSKPTDTTKLRNLGTVIRPNWDAIESADATFIPEALNLADRTALGVANDPTALADTVILYSKQDGAGKPQAYTIDPDSTITQLTGGTTTFAVKGHILLPNGFKMNWGTIASTGSVAKAELFESAFTTACYSITVTPITDTGTRTAVVVNGTVVVAGFSIKSSNAGMNVYYTAIGK